MNKNIKYWSSRIIFILCFLCLMSSLTVSQTIKGSYSYKNDVGKLLERLNDDCRIKCVPKYFFGEVFDYTIPDLVVFINKGSKSSKQNDKEIVSSSKIILTKNGKDKKHLYGEQHIYVMVFVVENEKDEESVKDPKISYVPTEREVTRLWLFKTKIKSKESFKKSLPLSVKHEFLKRRPGSGEFALLSVAKGFASAFTGLVASEKEPEEKKQEDPPSLEMNEVGCHEGKRLTFGMHKITLAENSINRISILGIPNFIPVATFGNYSGSWITSSVSAMATFIDSGTAEDESTSRILGDAYLLGHYYLMRPELPYLQRNEDIWRAMFNRASISVVVGTKLSDKLFEFKDIFVGLSIGHFMHNNLGIVFGCNFRTPNIPDTTQSDPDIAQISTQKDQINEGQIIKRKRHWSIGITYIF